ncbi:hypothetical protein Q0M94_07445 [Deinococcus radiomollis]|uniref:hypothetical protein n=1 Tax=Deinococcus radiomollis TaxID=468916 RepID=UPI003892645D
MSSRDRRQTRDLIEKQKVHETQTRTPGPAERTYTDQRASAPRALTDLEFVALRLHETAIRKDGKEALNMDVAVASVDSARALLREARRV